MKPVIGTIAIAFLLSACADTAFGTKARQAAAKRVVNQVIEDRAPGVNAEPVTDCIIDNATGSEMTSLAGDAITGVTQQTAAIVLDIATRPATVGCLVESMGPILAAEVIAAGRR